jgi:hypothetical protein
MATHILLNFWKEAGESNPGLDLSLWWGIIASLKNGTVDVCSYI